MDNFSVILCADTAGGSDYDEYLVQFAKYNGLNEVISENDLALVREYCVEKGVNYEEFKALQTDYSEFRCDPPLCVAAMKASVEIIHYLVELGFDPSDYGTADMANRCNPMQFAAANGATNAARVLAMRYKADVNYPNDSQYSPLMLAIYANDIKMVRVLVGAGANTSPGMSENTSPLHSAASLNHWDICEFLISSGADVNSRNTSGYTALHSACNGGSCYRITGDTLSGENCFEAARALVTSGADVNALSSRSKASPLFIAVSENCLELVTFLCSHGADPQLQNKSGNAALHIAVTDARYDIARYLVVEVNVDMQIRTFHSQSTPFKFALCNKSEKAVRLLLGAGHHPDENCRRNLHNIVAQSYECIHEDLQQEDISWYACAAYAQQVASNTRTLQELCCFTIRRVLGRDVSTKLATIDLPHTVKDIITLRHL